MESLNSAIAAQHRADEIDIGESEPTDVLGDSKPDFFYKGEKFGLDEPSWGEFWDIISRSKEWKKWMEYRLQTDKFEEIQIERRQENLFRFLSRRVFRPSKEKIPAYGGRFGLVQASRERVCFSIDKLY